jgi:hypothetical protein
MIKIKARTFSVLLFLGLGMLFISCESTFVHEPYSDTITDNYAAFCDEYAASYGAFIAKDLNWDSLRIAYAEGLNDSSSEGLLYSRICALLNEVNDGHADISGLEHGYYRSWNRRNKSLFSDRETQDFTLVATLQSHIRSDYMNDKFISEDAYGWLFFFGKIEYEGKEYGYLCIPTFGLSDFPKDFVQTAIDSMNQLDGAIIDLRYNGGGTTTSFYWCLNAFSSEAKIYLKSQYRNGPAQDDFTQRQDHWINPHENALRNIPLVVLMNAYTASSSEHLILGLITQENVVTVGENTCGAFSSVRENMLPNGWKFRLGSQVIYHPDGDIYRAENGKYIEGIGIQPDYDAPDKYWPALTGNDAPLDTALSVLSAER